LSRRKRKKTIFPKWPVFFINPEEKGKCPEVLAFKNAPSVVSFFFASLLSLNQ